MSFSNSCHSAAVNQPKGLANMARGKNTEFMTMAIPKPETVTLDVRSILPMVQKLGLGIADLTKCVAKMGLNLSELQMCEYPLAKDHQF